MNSPHQREQLPDLLSDALNETERARVESHLESCEQCARELRALELMQQSLVALPVATAPDSIRIGVREALRQNSKQSWTLSAFLANRARAKAADSSGRPMKSSERIGAPRPLLPFALPSRQLAWGGAVAVSAIGLMLLARPSLNSDRLSQSAPVAQADRASESGTQNAKRDAANAMHGTSKTSGKTTAPTVNAKNKDKPNVAATPKIIDGSNAPLPPLPSPPARTRSQQTDDSVAAPPAETPSIEPSPKFPSAPTSPRTPRNNQTKPRLDTPTKNAPAAPVKTPVQPSAPAKPSAPVKPSAPTTAPKTGERNSKPEAESFAPAPSVAEAPPATDSSKESSSFAGGDATADSAPSGKGAGPPMARSRSIAPSTTSGRMSEAAPSAPAQKSDANSPRKWTGGDVSATLKREDTALAARPNRAAKRQSPVLTLSVAKAIGNARLFLILPDGEIQIWRGSLNAAPVEILLNHSDLERADLRSGQQIRARLEQTDSFGNPIGNTTFPLVWP